MKHPFDVHVGSKLSQCRCSMGMSRQQLGDMLGASAEQIQRYENGACRINPNVMRDIVVGMEAPASFFFEGLVSALSEAA
jgi:transcriptional regulator with XRE-family HTH domain